MGRLLVRLIRAQNLALASEWGYTEPYCTFQLGTTKHTISAQPSSQKKLKSKDPVFNKSFSFDVTDPYSKLLIRFYDKDESGAEHDIGEATLSISHLKRNQEVRQWCRLINCLSGDVELALTIDFDISSLSHQQRPHVPAVAPAGGAPHGYPPAYAGAPLSPIPPVSYGVPQVPPAGWPPAMPPPSYAPVPSGWPPVMPPPMAPVPQPYAFNPLAQQAPPKPREKVNEDTLLMTLGPAQQESTPAKWQPRQLDPRDIQRDFPHIAKGSFGVVFTGHIRGFPNKVVIKDMEVHNSKNIEDWKKEITMMARMQCPYVVEIYGHCASGRILTIVMEYMRRGSLYDVLHVRKEPLSLLQRFRMARQCALAVAYLHNAGVIHRDIKSMNILVNDDYCCKLTDFGCAKLISDRSIMNTANSGTPLWMAPEVKAGIYDFSADVYSLGLVLYELFENQLPAFDTVRQTVILPKEFKSANVVLSCVAAKPSARPTAAQVVKMLDKLIRNIVNKVRKQLPPEEEALLKRMPPAPSNAGDPQFTDDASLDAELKQLYTHLLSKSPAEVDALINKAFSQTGDTHSTPPSQSTTKYPQSSASLQPKPQQPQPQQPQPQPLYSGGSSAKPVTQPNAPAPSQQAQQPSQRSTPSPASSSSSSSSPSLSFRNAPTTQYPPPGYAYNLKDSSGSSLKPSAPTITPPTTKSDISSGSSVGSLLHNSDSLLHGSPTPITPTVPAKSYHPVDQLLDLGPDLPTPAASAASSVSSSSSSPGSSNKANGIPEYTSSPATGCLVDLPETYKPTLPATGSLVDLPLESIQPLQPTKSHTLVDLSITEQYSPVSSTPKGFEPSSSGSIYPDLDGGRTIQPRLSDADLERVTRHLEALSMDDIRNILHANSVPCEDCFTKLELINRAKSTCANQVLSQLGSSKLYP